MSASMILKSLSGVKTEVFVVYIVDYVIHTDILSNAGFPGVSYSSEKIVPNYVFASGGGQTAPASRSC